MLNALRRFVSGQRAPGSVEAKASRAGPLIALSRQGQAAWSERTYAGYWREGYQQNPVAHRCIRMIAEAVASIDHDLHCADAEKAQQISALMLRPNPRQSRADLVEALVIQLLISGSAYVELVSLEGVPREWHVLRSDRMRVLPGPDGWPAGYDYRVHGRSVRFTNDDGRPSVLEILLHHPGDDHYGLSPIAAAAAAIDIHNEASRWNKALLDNAARPSGALVYANDGANLTDEQFDRLRRELEDVFQGATNAGRPMLLEGGLDWKPLSLSPKDMDFIDLKTLAAREIALAFGVPPLILGLPGDNTHANYAEANRAFWRMSVAPLAKRIAAAISGFLSQHLETPVELMPDFDSVDAMTDVREALWRSVTAADFLTPDEKRKMLGFGPLAEAAGRAS
jgi:HK97 family phage portal protein